MIQSCLGFDVWGNLKDFLFYGGIQLKQYVLSMKH